MRDIQVEAKLERKNGKWQFRMTGPRWAMEDFLEEITKEHAKLSVSTTHFSSATPDIYTIGFSQTSEGVTESHLRAAYQAAVERIDELEKHEDRYE